MEHNNLPIGWRFFKIMMPGFQTRLNLPPIMCKKLNEKKPEEVVLEGQNGSFKVKIQEFKDQRLCFTEGWDEFVRQHGIALKDFALFKHRGSFHFTVILFDQTCCQKDVHVNPETSNNKDRGKNWCTGQENSSCFTTTIRAYNLRRWSSYLHIPRKFCASNNLSMSPISISLRGPCGKIWPAKIRSYGNTSAGGYVCILDGWKEFAVHYDLKVRDVCSFSFVRRPTSYSTFMVDVKILPFRPVN